MPVPLDPMDELRALATKIEAMRAELAHYIDLHCAEVKKGCDGVPVEAIKQMVTHNSSCLCAITRKILNEKAVALELERKAAG